jgi:hypothetical protein
MGTGNYSDDFKRDAVQRIQVRGTAGRSEAVARILALRAGLDLTADTILSARDEGRR